MDCLITHPNVMNGASLYWPEPNMLYVEGYALDEFCAGRCDLIVRQLLSMQAKFCIVLYFEVLQKSDGS